MQFILWEELTFWHLSSVTPQWSTEQHRSLLPEFSGWYRLRFYPQELKNTYVFLFVCFCKDKQTKEQNQHQIAPHNPQTKSECYFEYAVCAPLRRACLHTPIHLVRFMQMLGQYLCVPPFHIKKNLHFKYMSLS